MLLSVGGVERRRRVRSGAGQLNLNAGMIRGGDWPTTVAGECVTHCRLATYPGERIEDLKARGERATGQTPALYASTATTDARTFHLYGETPAVCFGPIAENEHGVGERVHLPSVTATAQAVAVFIADWCGVSEGS
jgi:acetylornithine deacetylase